MRLERMEAPRAREEAPESHGGGNVEVRSEMNRFVRVIKALD